MERTSMLLSKDEVIAVPTDTVYGLVCNLFSTKAVENIYLIKQRTANKPLVAFFKSIAEIEKFCIEIPDLFYKLADKFFPGPLTVVLKKNKAVPDNVTFGMDTLGVRIPNSKFLNLLLEKVEFPLASTSANISDLKSFVYATEVFDTFMGQIPLVINGGKCPLGLESTVIDLTNNDFRILREGFIEKELLFEFIK
jgi:L-threonylcarbamoyladenylate synthase